VPIVDTARIGGDQDFLGTGEVRFRVGHLFKYPFGVVGFVDAGDVVCDAGVHGCNPGGKLDFSNLHWAAGGGIRWTPVISVRLDIGYRLNRVGVGEPPDGTSHEPFFKRIAFHVSLGQAF